MHTYLICSNSMNFDLVHVAEQMICACTEGQGRGWVIIRMRIWKEWAETMTFDLKTSTSREIRK